MAGSGTGYRMGVWPLGMAFRVLAAGAAIAVVGGIVALVALLSPALRRQARTLPIAGATMIAALIAGGTFASWYMTAQHVPGIHDITTDTNDPPSFEALRAARLAAPNGLDYGGPAVAAQQHAAYPDVAEGKITNGPCARALFFPETGRFSKNREAIEHERAITERD